MNDSRPGQCRESLVEIQERILQRSVRVTRRRVDDQPGRLVDHNQVRIGMQEVQGNGLRPHRVGRLNRRVYDQAFATTHPLADLAAKTVERELAAPDPLLQLAPGKVVEKLGRDLVQAQSRLAGAHPGGQSDSLEVLGHSGRSLSWVGAAILS